MASQRRPLLFGAGVVAFLAAFIYLRALAGGFLWDDEILILGNALIRSWRYLPDIFTTPMWAGGGSYYRPLPIFTYLVDRTVWGYRAFGYHLTSVAIHAGLAAAFYVALSRRFRTTAAFWAAALFAWHPVNAESVVPVYCRDNLLVALWVVALVFLQEAPRSRRAGWLCVGFYALSLLAKESAVVFPLVGAAYALCYFSASERAAARWIFAALGAVAAAYVLARLRWLPFVTQHPLSVIADQPLGWRLWTFLGCLPRYLGLFLFPWRLHTERVFATTTLADPWPWAGLALLALWAAWAARERRRRPHVALGLAWFLVPLLPVSNAAPLAATMTEHWMYLPAMGLLWLAAGELDALAGRLGESAAGARAAGATALALGLVLCALGIRTVLREGDWRDAVTLYTRDLPYARNSFLLPNNLGVELFRRGRYDEAEAQFRAALALEPRYGTTMNNLGAVLEHKGDLDAAASYYRQAIQASDFALAYANLGNIFLKEGEPGKAVEVLEEGRRLHPYDDKIAANLLRARRASGSASP